MKWFISISVLVLSLSSINAQAKQNHHRIDNDDRGRGGQACAQRADRNCNMSREELNMISRNVVDCKQISARSTDDRIEVMRTRSGSVFSIDYSDRRNGYCHTQNYRMDGSGIVELKVLQGFNDKLFMRSDDGRLFYMYGNGEVRELLNSRGNSYSSITDISTNSGGDGITLTFRDGHTVFLDKYALEKRRSPMIESEYTYTLRDVFVGAIGLGILLDVLIGN